MPSVDVVSKTDLQALDNAINNVKREISTRFDFKNVKSEITMDRKDKIIHIITGDELKVKAVKGDAIVNAPGLKWTPSAWNLKGSRPPLIIQPRWMFVSRRVCPKKPARKLSNLSRVSK